MKVLIAIVPSRAKVAVESRFRSRLRENLSSNPELRLKTCAIVTRRDVFRSNRPFMPAALLA